jgi:tetratricopeptide (TPR) repeat protein
MSSARGSLFARLEPRHVVLVVVAAALISFLPSVADGFVFDDEPLIVRNPFAHDFAHAGRCFVTDLWDTPERPVAQASTRFYRPAVCLSYIVNWKLGGGAPWSFHLVNVALHAAACLLVARLALRWTRSVHGALLAALVFAVHPSRTENVIWVSGRTDLLMAVFLLSAHELAVSASRVRGAWAKWAAASALFAAAVLSKEVAVCWPLFLAVEIVVCKRESNPAEAGHDAVMPRRLSWTAGAAFAAAGVYLVIRANTLPIRPQEIESMTLPPALHAGYVALSLGYYVERIFFPWPQTFHFRPLAVVSGEPVLFTPSVVLGVIAAALWVFWLVRAWRRDRVLFAILAVATIVLLPILNVSYTGFPGTTADRFLYLPLLPVAIAAGRHAQRALEGWALRPLSPLVTGAFALVACAICWVRALDYVSNETVWQHELEVNPDNPQALAGLGQVMAARGDVDEGSALLRHALTPAALKYKLLANPSRYYLGLLELQGPRLADGNVSGLEALLNEIASLVGARARDVRQPAPRMAGDLSLDPPLWDEHFGIHLANAREHLAAAGALVASRLGHDDLMRTLLVRVGQGIVLDAPGHYNLALALGRAADYASARRELSRATDLDRSPVVQIACTGLDESLGKVEKLRADASVLPEPEARTLRADAYLELGAYLRAARQLRLAYLTRPGDESVAARYLGALVHARLDADADAVADRTTNPAAAKAHLADERRRLSPRTARAIAPGQGERWWESAGTAP